MDIDAVIDDIIKREGGHVDHPLDMGGETKFGITRALYASVYPDDVTSDSIRNLSVEMAHLIYFEVFYKTPHIDTIPSPLLQVQLLDSSVLHSPRRAIRWLQRIVGAKADGILGQRTVEAVTAAADYNFDYGKINDRLVSRRVKFMGRLAKRSPGQLIFLNGWLNRALSFLTCNA